MRRVLRGLVLSVIAIFLMVAPGWTAEDAVTATYFDNPPGGNITYTGTWTHGSGWSKAYNNTVSYSNQLSANVRLTFTGGSAITRLHTMAANRGTAVIFIDNNFVASMNDNATITRWQAAKTWPLIGNANTPHSIEVRQAGGGYIDADAFVVDIPTVTNGNFDNNHSQFKYIGNWTSSSGWSSAYNGTLAYSNNPESAVTFTFTGDTVA